MRADGLGLIGTEVDGYRIVEVIGRGGMGVVYKAVDVMLDRTVAIKLINPAYASEEAFLRRFSREARALAKLKNPHIVTIHALRRTEVGIFIVMEYVDGRTLGKWAAGGQVRWVDLVPVLKQALVALGHAHTLGVVHRDIKPANLMLTTSGEVKVMDFGIAKLISGGEMATASQSITGTLYYMSPEQVEKPNEVDGRSDLYSLAMTAYHLLTGAVPFDEGSSMLSIFRAIIEQEPPSIRTLNSSVPLAGAAVIERALLKIPDQRFQNASEMLEALGRVADPSDAETVAAFLPKITLPVKEVVARNESVEGRPSARNRAFWKRGYAVVALSLVVVAIVVGGVLVVNGEADSLATNATALREQEAAVGPSGSGTTPGSGPSQGGAASDSASFTAVANEAGVGRESGVGREASPGGGVEDEPLPAPIPEGTALVRSNPEGARVLIDGRDWGRTPASVSLPEGRYVVRLNREGYEPAESTVRISEGRTATVDERLTPAVGTLRISVRPWGALYVDGVLQAEQVDHVQDFELQTGSHTVQVRHPELGLVERQVLIEGGGAARVSVNLLEEVTLTVTAFDSEGRGVQGPIFIDGAAAGKWSPAAVQVRVGQRRIEVRAEGYSPSSRSRTINVRPGGTREPLRLTLIKTDG